MAYLCFHSQQPPCHSPLMMRGTSRKTIPMKNTTFVKHVYGSRYMLLEILGMDQYSLLPYFHLNSQYYIFLATLPKLQLFFLPLFYFLIQYVLNSVAVDPMCVTLDPQFVYILLLVVFYCFPFPNFIIISF